MCLPFIIISIIPLKIVNIQRSTAFQNFRFRACKIFGHRRREWIIRLKPLSLMPESFIAKIFRKQFVSIWSVIFGRNNIITRIGCSGIPIVELVEAWEVFYYILSQSFIFVICSIGESHDLLSKNIKHMSKS